MLTVQLRPAQSVDFFSQVSVPRRGSADGATYSVYQVHDTPNPFQSPEGVVLTVQRKMTHKKKYLQEVFQSPEGVVLTVQHWKFKRDYQRRLKFQSPEGVVLTVQLGAP